FHGSFLNAQSMIRNDFGMVKSDDFVILRPRPRSMQIGLIGNLSVKTSALLSQHFRSVIFLPFDSLPTPVYTFSGWENSQSA
ncbi:hypothetical protein, partial [Caldilinea sp.]